MQTAPSLFALAATVGAAASLQLACSSGSTSADDTGALSAALTGTSSPIVSAVGGKCLDDSSDSTTNGNKIQLYSCNQTAAQSWRSVDGTFVGPGGKCLDIAGDDQVPGTFVDLYECNGTNAQKWTVSGAAIKSTSGLCLDVRHAADANGTQVQLSTCNGTNAQQWTVSATPSAPDAGTGTDTSPAGKVLAYLRGLRGESSKRVLSGQHAQIWNGDNVSAVMSDVTPIASETGQSPSILGLVMNYATDSYAYDVSVANTAANQWWAKGGLVELSIYSNDPTFTHSSSGAPGSAIPKSAFHELTETNSAAYRQWHSQLDTYAAELHSLTDPGNVVLLRPFIELNGDWNWYGAQDYADFISVWHDMHDYLVKTKGVKNVLWIYNVNADLGGYSEYYPGADYVDIVGFDLYSPAADYLARATSGTMYPFLVSTGKPLILPEVGLAAGSPGADTFDNSKLPDILRSLPEVVGFVDWCQGWAIPNQKGASGLMNDPLLVNLAELPKGI